ncbi:MAG TPA: heme-copper oxidase subunit III [Candidatus Binataceae bacterium]|jgi:heme/copper-type cytochrome/quinol oxidase subunit 3
MSQAVADVHAEHLHTLEPAESPLTPESWGKLGMWVFLCADAMTFGAAIAAYAALRITNVNWPEPRDILGIQTTAVMTFILIVSSVTMVQALSGVKHGNQRKFTMFMAFTILGGLTFLVMQAFEWHHLIWIEGLSIRTSLFSATFFILTGFHGCHVLGGIIYNSVILLRGLAGKITQANSSLVEIAGLYWHFVDLVWILIFTFVYLI